MERLFGEAKCCVYFFRSGFVKWILELLPFSRIKTVNELAAVRRQAGSDKVLAVKLHVVVDIQSLH
jgi:hypothetical protein